MSLSFINLAPFPSLRSYFLIGTLLLSLFISCQSPTPSEQTEPTSSEVSEPHTTSKRIPVILDTDANNELDDQHAIAYLLFNQEAFDIVGITVNRTDNGGDVAEQYKEAERIVQLCGMEDQVKIYKGADQEVGTIKKELENDAYDGMEAVSFIVEEARKERAERLVLLPIGKLTNIALALTVAPDIADKVRVVWLGSNYPEPGEYNQVNDTAALSELLRFDVPFEMVMVRYGQPSGTDAVRLTLEEAKERLAGKGPQVNQPVEGRHGGTFSTFGDYAVNLFEHIDLYGDPPARALFDMAAVAIVKNPDWAEKKEIPAPKLVDGAWIEQADNERTIVIWENFNKEEILEDLFRSLE